MSAFLMFFCMTGVLFLMTGCATESQKNSVGMYLVSKNHKTSFKPVQVLFSDSLKNSGIGFVSTGKTPKIMIVTMTDERIVEFETNSAINQSICVADFDLDGKSELLILQETLVGPFLTYDKGVFLDKSNVRYPAEGGYARFLRCTDISGDGLIDIVAVGKGYINVYLNKGGYDFSYQFLKLENFYSAFATTTQSDFCKGCVFFSDLFSSKGKIYMLYAAGDTAHVKEVYEKDMSVITTLFEFDKQNKKGLFVAVNNTKNEILFLNYDTKRERLFEVKSIKTTDNPHYVLSADVNADGQNDILVISYPYLDIPTMLSIHYGPDFTVSETHKLDESVPYYPDLHVFDGEVVLAVPFNTGYKIMELRFKRY